MPQRAHAGRVCVERAVGDLVARDFQPGDRPDAVHEVGRDDLVERAGFREAGSLLEVSGERGGTEETYGGKGAKVTEVGVEPWGFEARDIDICGAGAGLRGRNLRGGRGRARCVPPYVFDCEERGR